MCTFSFAFALQILSLALCAVDPPPRREVLLDPVATPTLASLRFENGSFVAVHRSASPGYSHPTASWTSLLDRDGQTTASFYPGKADPEFTGFSVWDATLSPSLVLTVTGTAWKGQGLAKPVGTSVLVQFDARSAALLRVVRSYPVLCMPIASADDGSIWCIGPDTQKRNQRSKDYQIVHRFSPQGNRLADYIPRTAIDSPIIEPESISPYGAPQIRVASSGIVYVWIPATQQVAVLDPAAGAHQLYSVPPPVSPDVFHSVAFRPNGEMLNFLPTFIAEHPASTRYRLHLWLTGGADSPAVRLSQLASPPSPAPAGSWQIIPAARDVHYAGKSTTLIGLDGDFAILKNRVDRKVVWVRIQPN